jgi:hypothetical protein
VFLKPTSFSISFHFFCYSFLCLFDENFEFSFLHQFFDKVSERDDIALFPLNLHVDVAVANDFFTLLIFSDEVLLSEKSDFGIKAGFLKGESFAVFFVKFDLLGFNFHGEVHFPILLGDVDVTLDVVLDESEYL